MTVSFVVLETSFDKLSMGKGAGEMRRKMVEYPDDACIVARPPWWMILYSPSEKQFYLEATDDDAGPLPMARGHLEFLMHEDDGEGE